MTDLATAPHAETSVPITPPSIDGAQQTPTPAEQNAGTHIPGEQAPDDTASRARAMGWVPKEEYRGNPDNWRDADEFVRRGEEILPIVQERNRDLTRRLNEVESRLAARDNVYKTDIRKLEAMTTAALDRQRQQLLGDYDAAMRNAAANADVERYDQLRADRTQAVQRFDKQIAEQVNVAPQKEESAAPPELKEWIDRNKSWYETDAALNMEAQAIHIALQRDHPYMSLADNLKGVEQMIKQRYPKKFGIQSQPAAVAYGAVEGGGSRMSSGTRAKGVNDLPSEAKVQGQRFVAQGLYKDLAEYAREYHAQD